MLNLKRPPVWPSQKHRPTGDLNYEQAGVFVDMDWRHGHKFLHLTRSGIPISVVPSDVTFGLGLRRVYEECATARPTISTNSRVLRGKPCIAGTRIPVALILRYLATGEDPVEDFDLTPKDISDCLEYAAMVCDYSATSED